MKGFITGGNRGIGLEFAKQLSEKDGDIYVGCREPEKANKLKKIIPLDNIILLDVKLEDSIQSAVQVLKTKIERLDLIINNAGIIGNRAGLNKVEIDDHLETFMTNTIGPLFITKYCLPLLGKDSTVVNISSLMGSIDDTSGGSYSYRISKAALNMLTKNLQEDLKGRSISVVSLHPGWVRTRMGTPVAPVSTKRSVSGMLKVLETEKNINGKFINFKGEELPW